MAATMEVLNDGDNTFVDTNEELPFLVNDRLPLEQRVHVDTPGPWKNGHVSTDAGADLIYVNKNSVLPTQ